MSKQEKVKYLGIGGAILAGLGTFLPFITTTFGDVNYFKNGEGDGMFILAIAVVSFLLFVSNKLMLVAAAANIGGGVITFLDMQEVRDSITSMNASLVGNPWAGLVANTSLGIGVYVIFLGLGAGLVAACLNKE